MKIGVFSEFNDDFKRLFPESQNIITYFIHANGWRRDYFNEIDTFLNRDSVIWDVFLPNLQNKELISLLKKQFPDSGALEARIYSAYLYFQEKSKKYKNKIRIHLFDQYPTYSLYVFNDTAIISMFPLSSKFMSTPTLMLNWKEEFHSFFESDYKEVAKIKKISLNKFSGIIRSLKNDCIRIIFDDLRNINLEEIDKVALDNLEKDIIQKHIIKRKTIQNTIDPIIVKYGSFVLSMANILLQMAR